MMQINFYEIKKLDLHQGMEAKGRR